MTAQTEDVQATDDGARASTSTGSCRVTSRWSPGATGVGDPPGEVRAVRHRDLAALVSDV